MSNCEDKLHPRATAHREIQFPGGYTHKSLMYGHVPLEIRPSRYAAAMHVIRVPKKSTITTIAITNAISVHRNTDHLDKPTSTLILDEFYGTQELSLVQWIKQASLPFVGELLPGNFDLYASRRLPMVILFLDLSHSLVPQGVNLKSIQLFGSA